MGQVAAFVACVLAWFWRLSTSHAKIDQWHGLLLASAWVLIVLWQKQVSKGLFWRLLLVWAIPIVIVFRDAYGIAWLWFASWMVVALACSKLDNQPSAVRKAVLAVAICQLPFVLAEVLNHPLLDTIGGGFSGSLGRRYLLGALFSLCSIWTRGWQAWAWMIASGITGSLTGLIPAALKLFWKVRWRVIPIGLMPVALALKAKTSIILRWETWKDVLPYTQEPVGFKNLRGGGFLGDGLVDQLLGWQDYHNTILELWARFNLWAIVLCAICGWWFVKRTTAWVCLWAAFLVMLQSLEAYPAGVWLLAVAALGGKDGQLGSVQKT